MFFKKRKTLNKARKLRDYERELREAGFSQTQAKKATGIARRFL